jgi:hypothetical protein
LKCGLVERALDVLGFVQASCSQAEAAVHGGARLVRGTWSLRTTATR